MELCRYPEMGNVRTFHIEAIQIPIVYNKYGDYDPDGLLYVLEEDAERIKREALQRFRMEIPQPYEEVRPLVIRVNLGDTVKIRFRNSLNRRLSIHVQGLSYDVNTSDGSYVGYNNDSTTSSGEIWYTWYADTEGVYLFNDMADPRSTEDATNIHGLFGAVIVEAPEAKWFDPETGEELKSGLMADVYQPGKPAFREYSIFFHDELEILNREGVQPIDPHTGLPSSTTAISYRSEPMRNRMPETHDPADSAEDVSMSSWVYGDPAPPILFAYVGDPVKIRLLHGGVKETHVFHLHNHQWRLEADNPASTILDSITIGPQECYTLDILYGAGSLNHVIGDVIFHCHLYPHFMEGMWTLWRIYDRLQDGTGELPDRTSIRPLMPLKDREFPPKKDKMNPGYPNFIEGIVGESPLQPPLGVLLPGGGVTREPTPLERANFAENAVPGALYTDTCPCHTDRKIKVFEIAMVQADITYNRYGWHDPQGRFFVLKEDLERHDGLECYIRKVEKQEIKVEPLVIRANAGDCIELHTTNLLPEFIEGSPFQQRTRTDIVGHHLHLVKFDTIVSDGSANGWNNIAGARRYETLVERFFANEELRTVFFHDHLFANVHQQHGLFGALIIEEAGATFHDPQSGKELHSGTRAVIRRKNGTSFREFALFVHDFAFLFDRKGNPLNPPKVPGSHNDPGVMGINYRAEPMRERLRGKEDPACPSKDDVIRRYEVVAVQKKLIYNEYGDNDPDGLVFVPLEDVDNVLAEKCMPKPLILRANTGDWIEVTLHNAWDPEHPIPYFSYPTVPLDMEYTPSMRVSLNPQFLQYDPVCDSGINVGYNEMEQTVGVGESKRYLWHADQEYGACIIQSFGDMRNHRYHGLFGAVIVEPSGSQWYRNFTEKKDSFAERAVITAPGAENFREYVLFIQNGIRLLDVKGNLIRTAAADNGEPVDAEDTGEKGYNYRSERFANRLARDSRIWKVFSSKVHGDPATPVWKAYPGDRVIFRTVMPADKPRNTSIAVHDHLWREQQRDPFSRIIPLQGGVSIGNKFDIELSGGAGCPGDYLYRSGNFAWDVESGMWGIFRVVKRTIWCRCKGIYRKIRGYLM